MLLTDEGKKEFLKNKFHQFFDITLSNTINPNNVEQFANFTLSLEKINEFFDFNEIKSLFNDEYNNVVFTPANDIEKIYQYEYYQKVFFIRMKPFSNIIRMHIVPKKYDASNTKASNPILFFKDNKQKITDNNFSCTSQYERKPEKKTINSYYKKNVQETSNAMYKFNIKKHTKNMNNLQINMGYSYNDTNPTNQIRHYTGIIDESDETGHTISPNNFTEFNSALMDANLDNVHAFTNMIIQQEVSDQINWPSFALKSNQLNVSSDQNGIQSGENTNIIGQLSTTNNKNKEINFYNVSGFDNRHTELLGLNVDKKIVQKTEEANIIAQLSTDDNQDKSVNFYNVSTVNEPDEIIYHKTIKYFNDDMYIEENGKYSITNWIERG